MVDTELNNEDQVPVITQEPASDDMVLIKKADGSSLVLGKWSDVKGWIGGGGAPGYLAYDGRIGDTSDISTLIASTSNTLDGTNLRVETNGTVISVLCDDPIFTLDHTFLGGLSLTPGATLNGAIISDTEVRFGLRDISGLTISGRFCFNIKVDVV